MEVESLTEPRVVKNIILSFLFFLWIAWIWARRNLYRFTLKFPGGLGQLAFGTIIEIQNLHNIDEAITNYFQRFKQYTICLWLGFYPMLVTAEPELVEKILTSPDLLNKSPPMYSPVDTVSRGGLLSSPVSKWRRNRKLIVPSFSHNVLMSFLPIFHNTKVSLLSKLEDMVGKGEHSLSEVIARATLTASIRYCSLWRVHKLSFNCPHIQWYFGLYIANLEQDRKSLKQKVGQYKMNDSTSNETTMGKRMTAGEEAPQKYAEQIRFILKSIVHHISLSFLKLGFIFNGYPKYNTTKKELHQVVFELIKEKGMESAHKLTVAEDDGNIKKTPRIFIDQAIELYKQNKFSSSDVIAESNTLVATSFETTANGIFSTLVMLATHPVIQERLFEEIVTVFPDKDFSVEYEHIQKLPYLDMIIKETLRLSPAVTLIGRNVVKDTQLAKDLILPKGLQVLISIYHLQRRTDVWGPKANEFNPDNFLPENFERIHTYAYLPFSKGIRNCIGWRYAILSMKVVLCGFIRNYRFSTSAKFEELRIVNHVSMKYANEPQIAIHRRA